jgi:large subunit ribosomal protein L13
MIGYRSFVATPSTIESKWYVVDAKDKVLGKLATEVAHRLRGKHKPTFTPHMDCGDHIIVINADKIAVTGKKRTDKKYYRYTGYVGNLKTMTFEHLMQRSPTKAVELAVKGMLPRGPLGRSTFKKLKVYAGETHTHSAQNPEPLEI